MNAEHEETYKAAARLKEQDRVYRKLRTKAAIALEALEVCDKEIEKFINGHKPDETLQKLMMRNSVAYYPLRDANNDFKERGETL
ncbi:hypothetical protein OEZ84_28625, partial [Leclercia adecarboxylata]|uniref:hypothetical protein n=1 Tax=Leclercia adecarboxylata TaxID=83655 RepID=UPI00234C7354